MKRKIVTISEDEILTDLIKDKEFAKKQVENLQNIQIGFVQCVKQKRENVQHIL